MTPRLDVYGLPSATLLWTWVGPTSHDDQLIPSDIAISNGFIALSTWGDYGESADPCPQVYLFSVGSATPIFSYITPGSMFTIDVVALPLSANVSGGAASRDVWVFASGKSVHANQ